MPSHYDDVDLTPPQYIQDAAAKGLVYLDEGLGGDGLTDGTIAEARAMARGDVTADKVRRASAWGARHATDLDTPANSNKDADGFPGPGAVAHYLWGIDPLDPAPARAWFDRKAEELEGDERMTIPTDNLVRHVEFRAEPSTDGLTLDGYAAVFDTWTNIESSEGTFRERIARGAFTKTIAERTPVLQFDHGTHPVIGSIPLGRITSLEEDEYGLRVRARLADNWLVEPVRDAIANGSVDGMSFRFRVIGQKWDRNEDRSLERTITEIALYEVGPVVYPAYEATSVGVRSAQVAELLGDPTVRQEVARALLTPSGTPTGAAEPPTRSEPVTHSDDGTPVGAASPDLEPDSLHSGRTRNQRQALARLRLPKDSL